MHVALPLTSADKIPAEAISEVVEHTVAMLLEGRKEMWCKPHVWWILQYTLNTFHFFAAESTVMCM